MSDIAISYLHVWPVIGLIVAAIAFYSREDAPLEAISVGVVLALLLFFHLAPLPEATGAVYGPAEILAGFANPALITVMALLVVGQGMFQTGATEGPARRLAAWADRAPRLTLLALFAVVFVVSAFLNNTPVVVMFIPILASLAQRLGASASRLMMPLSFVCILAGMTTLIGSSTNLLVADALQRLTGESLDFFAPTRMGALLAGVGLVYLMIVAPRLLPDRASLERDYAGGDDGRQFIAQLDITPNHPLVGARPVAGLFAELPDMTVRLVQRGERAILPPFEDMAIRPGDAIIVAATRRTLTELLASRPEFLRGVLHTDDAAEIEEEGEGYAVLEAVVAPGARIIARSIEHSGIRAQTGAIVLGVQRHSRMLRGRLADVRLEAGDVLLMMGSRDSLKSLRRTRDLLPLGWSLYDVPDIRRAMAARLVFAGVVLAAASGLLPILHAAVAGGFAMIMTRCLNLRQAARALDLRIFLLIGAAFAMGGALEASGGASLIARGIAAMSAPFGTLATLSALFLGVMLLTNILSNSATAILFAPIAVNAAKHAGADPSIFVLTVLFAANCSFATPVAYQTNLLVMGPGRYQFADFLRLGAPLALIIWIAFTALAPQVFDLSPAP